MLNRSGRTVFVKIDAGTLELAIALIVGSFKGKAGADVTQINGADAFLAERH